MNDQVEIELKNIEKIRMERLSGSGPAAAARMQYLISKGYVDSRENAALFEKTRRTLALKKEETLALFERSQEPAQPIALTILDTLDAFRDEYLKGLGSIRKQETASVTALETYCRTTTAQLMDTYGRLRSAEAGTGPASDTESVYEEVRREKLQELKSEEEAELDRIDNGCQKELDSLSETERKERAPLLRELEQINSSAFGEIFKFKRMQNLEEELKRISFRFKNRQSEAKKAAEAQKEKVREKFQSKRRIVDSFIEEKRKEQQKEQDTRQKTYDDMQKKDLEACRQMQDELRLSAMALIDETCQKLDEATQEVFLSFLKDENLVSAVGKERSRRSSYHPFHAALETPSVLRCGQLSFRRDQVVSGLPGTMADQVWNAILQLGIGISLEDAIWFSAYASLEKAQTWYLQMNTEENMDMIRSITFETLMQYPAGRLHLLMIAPRKNDCFGGLVRLGINDHSIVNTRVWDAKPDIAAQLSRFRSSLNDISSSFYAQKDVYLKTETHHLIAIADFPYGFDEAMLDDLDIILDSATDYGTHVLICENSEVLREYFGKPELRDRIERIRSKMTVYRDGMVTERITSTGNRCLLQYRAVSLANGFDEQVLNELCAHVDDLPSRVVTLEEVHEKMAEKNEWISKSTLDGIVLPIGIVGVSDQQNLILGRGETTDKRQHALIEGTTGSGKSVLMHAIITSALLCYGPQELQLVLLDYKEGVEFKTYADYDLPGVRVVSTGSEREFGQSTFRQLVKELEYRAALFKRELPDEQVPGINAYRRKTGKIMPYILFLVDEFESLIRGGEDDIARSVLRDLGTLVKQGRAVGIHVILASQSISLPDDILSQMAVRIALDGSRHLLSGSESLDLLKRNQAVLNDNCGEKANDHIFQVTYAEGQLRETLRKISEMEAGIDPSAYLKMPKKILHAGIEEFASHPFNTSPDRFVPLSGDPTKYAISIGENSAYEPERPITFAAAPGSHLLIALTDPVLTETILTHTALSLLYDSRLDPEGTKDPVMDCIDLTNREDDAYDLGGGMAGLSALIPERITYLDHEKILSEDIPYESVRNRIGALYREMLARQGGAPKHPKFLMLKGLDCMRALAKKISLYADDDMDAGTGGAGDLSALDQLKKILRDGPKTRIHVIGSFSDYTKVKNVLGEEFEAAFDHRIASNLGEDLMYRLVNSTGKETLNGHSALRYQESTEKTTLMRIYDEPGESWIRGFCEKLK